MKIMNPQTEEALQVLRQTGNHTYKSFNETAEHKREKPVTGNQEEQIDYPQRYKNLSLDPIESIKGIRE